jgi:hypothetical protein
MTEIISLAILDGEDSDAEWSKVLKTVMHPEFFLKKMWIRLWLWLGRTKRWIWRRDEKHTVDVNYGNVEKCKWMKNLAAYKICYLFTKYSKLTVVRKQAIEVLRKVLQTLGNKNAGFGWRKSFLLARFYMPLQWWQRW